MDQIDETNGEVEILNSNYSTTRFPFSWSWWSAYGWERHLTGRLGKGPASDSDRGIAEGMQLVNQKMAYDQCGHVIMEDLMQGNAIVLFAYGLSGSGKTFTVFGPDAPDIPEAWFKHETPHPMWGIFPQLAYDLFQKKTDGWKISMKYFQNVVDTVRDLMSPVAKEMNYKSGMRKDKDGFMDIEWCQSEELNSWDDLRSTFLSANSRKAIAPTQFNHQSTRGHCIMVLEVEMPHPTIKGTKQRGRIYVCDLAGTEPAGDIVYAEYKKVSFDDGSIEHKYLGPHADQSKTKQLQDQGKKINLSLSEMASFFLKMASAVQQKKLGPGQSIPGCNTYFLCKFLKDTMLQAKTYLFCAIRPEVQFHKYTFATLGFAKNASVIKLQPKKATTAASSKEMLLMEELERMKKQMEGMAGKGGDMEEFNRKLTEKQEALRLEMRGEVDLQKQKEMEEQRTQYAVRGITLSVFVKEPSCPFLVNLEEDSFRDRRFLFLFEKDLTSFGRSLGDVKPLNMNMVDNHCSFEKDLNNAVTLIGGDGPTYHNGILVEKGVRVAVSHHDRVVVGSDVMLFKNANSNALEEAEGESINAATAISEYHNAVQAKDSAFQEQARKLAEDKKKLEEELARMKKEGVSAVDIDAKRKSMEAWKAIDETMIEMVPVLNKMNAMCGSVGRGMLNFKLSLQQPTVDLPFVKVQATNTETNTVAFLEPFEVQSKMNLLADQILDLKTKEQYTVPPDEEIIKLLFDTSYQIGSSTNFLIHCALLMETDEEDQEIALMKSVIPYNKIGSLNVVWQPMQSPDDETLPSEEIIEPEDLIGKSWTYKLNIGKLKDLPTPIAEAYVSYEFYGQRYVTDVANLSHACREVDLEYSEVLHIDCVDEAFIQYLDQVEFKFEVYIKPWVVCNLPPLSNGSMDLCKSLGIVPSAEMLENSPQHKLEKLQGELEQLLLENKELKAQLDLMRDSNYEKAWKQHCSQLEEKISKLELFNGPSKVQQKLQDAKSCDSKINK